LGFDGVDINMACPDKNVMKSGAGGSLMINQPLAEQIIKAVKAGAPNLPISVKTRLGYNKIITEEWIGFLLRQNLAALTIHGRVAKQMSRGEANWVEIGKAVELKNQLSPETKLIGNGDVLSIEKGLELWQKYKVDGVMIGRGIFHNPWVFERQTSLSSSGLVSPISPLLAPHTNLESIKLLLAHVRLHSATWDEQNHNHKKFEALKKFFKMYINNFPGASELRQQLMTCSNANEVEKTIKDYLSAQQ
jgi:tRNA-dihydrouridine synthase